MDLLHQSFPFRTRLSFESLIAYIQQKQSDTNTAVARLATETLRKLEKVPALHRPIDDPSLLEEQRELIDLMMTFVVSPNELDQDILAASAPFEVETFFSSQAWDAINDSGQGLNNVEVNWEEMLKMKIMQANHLVLHHIYGQEYPCSMEVVVPVREPATGLNKYYRIDINSQLATVKALKKPRNLSPEEIQLLKSEFLDLGLWQQYIPYEDFEIQGIIILKLTDVTDWEVESAIKYQLLRKDALSSDVQFPQLERNIQELFQLPDLRLGVVLFDLEKKASGEMGPKIWNSLINQETFLQYNMKEIEGCVYHRMMEQRSPLVVDDLKQREDNTVVEETFIRQGLRNVLMAPLEYEGNCLGSLELASPHPGELNNRTILKLESIMPVFSLAAKRSLEELDHEVQAQIKEDYTALHPAVEWRFQEVAARKIDQKRNGLPIEAEPIVFKDVYPLYGLSDIRGSTAARNRAIQIDLQEQMALAKAVLSQAYEKKPLPIIQEVIFRLEKFERAIEKNIGSGDELNILFYFEQTVEPLLRHFQEIQLLPPPAFKRYFDALDPELGIVYNQRKAFENSVTLINETVATFLDEQEQQAQALFPHYYERYKTDGIEYNIYIGQSLVNQHTFNPIYLRNLRLWQLSITGRIAQLTHSLKPSLPLPLETAQLILVHSTPIAIRFREDEKQFDVDGAYNIRYEIVKKRIDKATIKGSRERLT
ncbi:MAG: GAF domain-containing protein [Bacteroidetes bacterium]|nr:MAG: GAF domain-containing protein [Bacteroidota bacterium]